MYFNGFIIQEYREGSYTDTCEYYDVNDDSSLTNACYFNTKDLNYQIEIIEEVEDKEYEDIDPLVLRTFERTGQVVTIDRLEDYCFYNFEQIENTLAKVILNQKKIIERLDK